MADTVRMTHSNGVTVTVAADAVERMERVGFTRSTPTAKKATAKKAAAKKSTK